MEIKFGTDGWRGIIAKDFTFQNVRLCAQGTVDLMKRQGVATRGLVVGYDTRFASDEFALAVAEVSASNGVKTLLSDRASPTPVISYNLVNRGAGGGVVITASHNPAQWNGFKFKPDYGGSASPKVIEELEKHIAEAEVSGSTERITMKSGRQKELIELFDPEPSYLEHVASQVDLDGIRRAGLKVVVDSMFGAGAGYLAKLISDGTTGVIEIHGERNPAFPGMSQPEPLAHNLGELMEHVKAHDADLGIATDGDADRVGIVDERGRFITTLQTFALLCMYQLDVLKRRGPLVRSITMTSMIDRLGELYGVPVFDTPVGFKYLGQVMMREDALVAGEESGGYAFRGNIPERDGILSGLMILDMMMKTGKTVSELLRMLTEKVGPHHYHRWDLQFKEGQRAQIQERVVTTQPSTLGGRRVKRIDMQDGFRFELDGGYWAMVRFSGTEPLLRIYAEAASPREVTTLLGEVRALADV